MNSRILHFKFWSRAFQLWFGILLVVGSNGLVMGQDCSTAPPGLVAWWPGDGSTDEIITGLSGSFSAGTYATGFVNQAFQFNGIDQPVEVADAPVLNPSNAITLEVWVLATEYPSVGFVLISKDAQFSDRQYLVTLTSGRVFQAHIGIGSGFYLLPGVTEIELNTWYHLAMTYDGTELKLYLDGNLENTQSLSGNIIQTSQPLRIGGGGAPPGNPDYFFRGMMDELSLYHRALTSAEIESIFDAGRAGKCIPIPICFPAPQGLTAWWKADGDANDRLGRFPSSFPAQTFAEGLVGQAFLFDGISASVEIANAHELNPTNAISVEAWVLAHDHPPSFGFDIISKDGENSDRQFVIALNSSRVFQSNIGVASGFHPVVGATEVELNTWYHVAFTYDRTQLKLYVNGVLENSQSVTGAVIQTQQPVRIGGGASAGALPYFFPGMIDEVSFYSRALEASEIEAIFTAGTEGKCPPTAILDGSFEREQITTGVLTEGAKYGPWTVDQDAIRIVDGRVTDPLGVPYWLGADGAQSVDLSGQAGAAGSIYQDLPTTPGQRYRLRFAMAGNPDAGPTVKQMNVFWDGGLLDSPTFDITGHTRELMGWVYHDHLVTASTSMTRLQFTSVTSSGFGPVIDDISVTHVFGPIILQQPEGLIVKPGSPATISVVADGLDPQYQWRLNGEDFPGATNATLVIEQTQPAHAGTYDVLITDSTGGILSSSAVLSLFGVQALPGLLVYGPLESEYRIEYTTNFESGEWMTLTQVVLESSPFLFVDTSPLDSEKRFYRSVLVP